MDTRGASKDVKPVPLMSRALIVAAMFGAQVLAADAGSTGESAYLKASAVFPAPSGAAELCTTYRWACASAKPGRMSGAQELEMVHLVNKRVNATTRSIADQRQYSQREMWALPTSKGGDCEDFALLKKRDLVRMGLDPQKLLIATVLDEQRNSHAVLVYRSRQGDLVLDNLTDKIRPWRQTRYLFLRMQDPRSPKRWVAVHNKG